MLNKKLVSVWKYFALLILGGLISGCIGTQQSHNSSSVVDFLYGDTKTPVNIEPSIPVLSLPLRVGIAFVPNTGTHLSEQEKTRLMNQVAEHFKPLPYVRSIDVIPSPYLKLRGGFTNLDQIRTMYGIDVIALISYDQVQFTDENFLSLTYWSIVGAYIIPGEKNDTQTMLDTVVYDIASRKMLFRAPGSSHVKGRATPINLSEQLRLDSSAGLQAANVEMIKNLDLQLADFRQKVKERPQDYQIIHRPEYRGGGNLGVWGSLIFILGAACLGLARRSRQ